MLISITDVIIIVICIIISIIFMIFINRDKFSLNCKKNVEINGNLNNQTSIKFDDHSDFEDNIKLISNINKKYAKEDVLELI